MDLMCQFENGRVSPRATRWLHKISLFLVCLWDSKARTGHWIKKDWPVRSELIPCPLNVLAPPLMEHSKIVFPPLQLKLGIMKQLLKALVCHNMCHKVT